MYTTTLVAAAAALLGCAVLVSACPICESRCSPSRSILKCKNLTLERSTLKAICQDNSCAWVPTSIDLNHDLGNVEGTFVWGEPNFSSMASNIRLNSETAKLSATLKDSYGVKHSETESLYPRIQNDNGQLKYVPAADAVNV
ncbi:hypothetical protein BGZ68_000707 [Mortierella alpina]|nr:hypothetical protein BGZ68_000707 [Mortierella alpina]